MKVAEIVTEQIVKMLDAGVVPWRKPWRATGADIAINAWGRRYRGINAFLLSFARQVHGYESNIWLTFNQVAKQGGKVKEGSKSTLVVFWKVGEKVTKVDDNGKVTTSRPFILRYFNVFNLDQTAGVVLSTQQKRVTDRINENLAGDVNVIDDAEAIVASYFVRDDAPSLSEGGDRAFYSPVLDSITLPRRESFNTDAEWYSTMFHEVTHSTGAKSRVGRQGVDNFDHFGSEQYAAEELVAELGAAFLCAESGIDNTLENSAAYIANWKQRLNDDPNLIISAASKAQKAADYVLGAEKSEDEDA